MSRTKDALKHPALLGKAGDLRRRSAEVLETMPERDAWHELTQKEKTFLSYYIVSRDGISASQQSGLDLSWFEDRYNNDVAFMEMVNEVRDHPKALAQMVLEDYLPISLIKLSHLLDSPNENTVLAAIKHLHNIAGLVHSDTPSTAIQINNGVIKPFGNNPETAWASPNGVVDAG